MIISNSLKSYFIIISTIIGLGIFVLPYTFSQSGYFFLFWLFFWFFSFLILHLLFGEILFRSESKNNLPGLTAKYLHPSFKHLVWFFDYFGMLGVFLVYFIAFAKFWSLVFPGINAFWFKLFFALFNIYFILKEFSLFTRMESVLSLGILFLFLSIALFLLPYFEIKNIFLVLNNFQEPFLPYGVLLFAFSGISSMALVYDLIGKNKSLYFKINFWSLLTITFLYLFYVLVIVGFLGFEVSEASIESLYPYLPKFLTLLIIIMASLNMVFVDFCFYLKRGLIHDYQLSPKAANILITISVFLLIFLNPSRLVALIGFISEFFLAFNLLVISLIYLKLKEKIYFKIPSSLVVILSLIFLSGIIYALVNDFKNLFL